MKYSNLIDKIERIKNKQNSSTSTFLIRLKSKASKKTIMNKPDIKNITILKNFQVFIQLYIESKIKKLM